MHQSSKHISPTGLGMILLETSSPHVFCLNEENDLSVGLSMYYWETYDYSSYSLSLITVMVCIMLLKKVL